MAEENTKNTSFDDYSEEIYQMIKNKKDNEIRFEVMRTNNTIFPSFSYFPHLTLNIHTSNFLEKGYLEDLYLLASKYDLSKINPNANNSHDLSYFNGESCKVEDHCTFFHATQRYNFDEIMKSGYLKTNKRENRMKWLLGDSKIMNSYDTGLFVSDVFEESMCYIFGCDDCGYIFELDLDGYILRPSPSGNREFMIGEDVPLNRVKNIYCAKITNGKIEITDKEGGYLK